MNHGHTAASLIAFRDRIADAFREKKILCPVHFPSDTQAEPLLRIFEGVKPHDYCLSGWRNMFHALLKGIPEEEVYRQIVEGRSMFIHSAEYRFLSSSIVGGMLPTAVGLGMAIKRQSIERGWWSPEEVPTVWVFCGDMTATTGLFHEATQYAIGHNLPMRFIVEDNGYSTNARTRDVWLGSPFRSAMIDGYKYERTFPHCGLEQRVQF